MNEIMRNEYSVTIHTIKQNINVYHTILKDHSLVNTENSKAHPKICLIHNDSYA